MVREDGRGGGDLSIQASYNLTKFRGYRPHPPTTPLPLQVASGVVALWRRDKGLQASTNLVQACFSTGRDLVLFTDILQQFLKHRYVANIM